jgi:hypothetical protein
MPTSTTDKALTSGGVRARAFWKGSSGTGSFLGIGVKPGRDLLKVRSSSERGRLRSKISAERGSRKFQFEFEDFALILLMGKLEASIRIMTTKPNVKTFIGLEFIGKVLLLGDESLVVLEISVDIFFRCSLDNLKTINPGILPIGLRNILRGSESRHV